MIGLLAWEPGRERKGVGGVGGWRRGMELSGEGVEAASQNAASTSALHVCMIDQVHANTGVYIRGRSAINSFRVESLF